MLKDQLQSHFFKRNKNSKINDYSSLRMQFDKVHQLADELENRTDVRVELVTNKACKIFREVFTNLEDEIIALIHEFEEPNAFNASNKFLHAQFPKSAKFEKYRSVDYDIFIYHDRIKNINHETIIRSIANTDMGLEPAIDQKIYFFDIKNDKAFYMYDDRGCMTRGI